MRRPGAFATLAVALLAAGAAAQAPPAPRPTPRPPIFEAGVEIINLNVSVSDAQGRYVTGMTLRDFSVYEDGVRQDLSQFSNEQLPISLVVMIDSSASMEGRLPTAQAAAARFVKTLREQDAAEVVQFNDRRTVLQDFTSNHVALEAAIRRILTSGPTALHNALYVSLKELDKQKKANDTRRRAVVLLSDGEDTASLVDDEQVLELARRTEIAIYAISLTRHRVASEDARKFSQARHLLTALARDSGGQVFFPNSIDELESVYDSIAEELRSQYNLGYSSANARRDGRWRRIVVRIPSRDDVAIRHKLGYYAPR